MMVKVCMEEPLYALCAMVLIHARIFIILGQQPKRNSSTAIVTGLDIVGGMRWLEIVFKLLSQATYWLPRRYILLVHTCTT